MQGKQVAKEYLSSGLNPIPLRSDKTPMRKNWGSPMSEGEIDTYGFDDIGICTGIPSGGLEAIDFDLKYADKGNTIMKQYQDKVGVDLLKKVVIQATQNGGYHIIYRCPQIEGNRVIAKNSEGDVLIETRGDGGFIKCYPSPGYRMVQGSLTDIPIITPVERNRLFAAAYRFDEEAFVKQKRSVEKEHSRFPKFDKDSDIGLNMLFEAGWTEIYREDGWVELRRPGKTDGVSAGYNLSANFLYVHTTSTAFKDRTPYNNVDIYGILKCKGDMRVAYARLYEQGYGEKTDEQDSFEHSLDSLSFLSDKSSEITDLQQVIEGVIPMGKSTGWQELDPYFLLKPNSVNFGLGLDGVGKSLVMIHIAAASLVLHGMKWGMCMPENKTSMNRRRLIEALSGKPIGVLGQNRAVYDRYERMAYDNFFIVKNQKHYSMRDVLLMGQRLYEYYGIDCFLVDPYNFFKVEGNGYSWDNDVLSELRVFAEKYCSIYIMSHPASETVRKGVDNKGFHEAPSKYDIQGGTNFAYRVDDFFILHRIVNHPDPEVRSTMQFIMEKVKEIETGGSRHIKGQYTSLKWDTLHDFTGYWDSSGNNPIYEASMNVTPGGIILPHRPEIIV